MIRYLSVLLVCGALTSAAEPDRVPGSWWYTPTLEDLISEDPKVVITAILNEPEDDLRSLLITGYFRDIPVDKFSYAFNLLGELDARDVNYNFTSILAIFAERDPQRAWEFVLPYLKAEGPDHYFDDWNEDKMIPPADWRIAKSLPFVIEHGDVDAYLSGICRADLNQGELEELVERFYQQYSLDLSDEIFEYITHTKSPDQAVEKFMDEWENNPPEVDNPKHSVSWDLVRRLKAQPSMEELAKALQKALVTGNAGEEWMIVREWLRRFPRDRATLLSVRKCWRNLGWYSVSEYKSVDIEWEWVRLYPEEVAIDMLSRDLFRWMTKEGELVGLLEFGLVTLNKSEQKAVIDRSIALMPSEGSLDKEERSWLVGENLLVLAEQDPMRALELAVHYDEAYDLASAMILEESLYSHQTPARLKQLSDIMTTHGLPGIAYSPRNDEYITYIMEEWGDIDVGAAARAGVRWALDHPQLLSRRHLIKCWSGRTSAYDGCMDDRIFGCLRKWSVMDPEEMTAWARTLDDVAIRDALLWMVDHPHGRD